MARRFCPVCRKEVEEKVVRETDNGKEVVTKQCPDCGFVFIKYKVGSGVLVFMNEPVPEKYPLKKMKLF